MKRILLGYDASPASERALERTAELATAFGCPVVVASVAPVHEFAVRGVSTHYDPADPPVLHTQMARDAAAKLSERGIRSDAITGLGHAAETLVDVADAKEADLIVVGASSADLVTRFFGGVSDDVAHAAHCDVLVVR
jgi:nucleotide-binding universal stress UspA family protein